MVAVVVVVAGLARLTIIVNSDSNGTTMLEIVFAFINSSHSNRHVNNAGDNTTVVTEIIRNRLRKKTDFETTEHVPRLKENKICRFAKTHRFLGD